MQTYLPVYSSIRVYKPNDYYVFKSDSTLIEEHKAVIIDRKQQKLDVSVPSTRIEAEISKSASHLVYGILGVFRLESSAFVIVITEKSLVGLLSGHCIYRIDDVGCFPFSQTRSELPEKQQKQENTYLRELLRLLRSKDFFFSYTCDLTNTLERRQNLHSTSPQTLFNIAHDRFFWNRVIQDPLIQHNATEWILPVIRGSIQLFTCLVQGKSFEFALISRRSRYRAGTRYFTRGVDASGHVANFVETEQVVVMDDIWMSYVETRGSVPLLWTQSGYKYKPTPTLDPDEDLNHRLFTTHFDEQLKYYKKQIIVTLLDLHGVEAPLAMAYREHSHTLFEDREKAEKHSGRDVRFVEFDFHAETRGSSMFSSVKKLLDKMNPAINALMYTVVDSGKTMGQQTGVIRTNCLDCLDRTSLVQSIFAHASLLAQLKRLGFSLEKEEPVLERMFKEAWANNGDMISLQYAGTSALKGDVTRTGKRQTRGVMMDGVNSLSRYYINNFRDRLKQIAIDLLLGNYKLDDELDMDVLWTDEQMHALEECTQHLETSEELEEDETIEGAWIVVFVNRQNLEQERILVLTDKGFFRMKYDFEKKKIDHFRKYSHKDVLQITKGNFLSHKKNKGYGLVIELDPEQVSSSHSKQIYSALDLTSKEFVDKLCEKIQSTIISSQIKTEKSVLIVEDDIARKKSSASLTFKVYNLHNNLKIGRYRKNSKTKNRMQSKIIVNDPKQGNSPQNGN